MTTIRNIALAYDTPHTLSHLETPRAVLGLASAAHGAEEMSGKMYQQMYQQFE
jgi:hypothetical protein